ncbi:MAG: DMT family transporter [Planctomycetaceae bacterium]
MRGTFLGVLSAVFYTATNMTLRQLADSDDLDRAIWVTCNKAVPVALICWAIIAWRGWHGLPAMPARHLVLPLVATGLFLQTGGNIMFQIALSVGGLALSVPLCFATLIATGAILGKVLLGEPVTKQSAFAMSLLILSILLLSKDAQATAPEVAWTSSSLVVAAIPAACLSGVSYGACGVVIRRMLQHKLPVSATLVLMSSSGVVSLGLISLVRQGPAALAATHPDDFALMALAGVFNAAAFFSVAAAMKYITVVRANMFNATQVAMCAVAGVLMFGEPWTGWLVGGVLLTTLGVVLIGGQSSK